MLPLNFEYHRPGSAAAAVHAYSQAVATAKTPIFYAGGLEIISRVRQYDLQAGAVIDIKNIPECHSIAVTDDDITIGAAATLSQVADSGLFPLLARVCRGCSDRITGNKATIGGNICGQLPYREVALPFMLADSLAMVANPNGQREMPLQELIAAECTLAPGELLVSIRTPLALAAMPWGWVRRTRQSAVDYPLVSIAGMRVRDQIRIAVSGLSTHPFRSVIPGNNFSAAPTAILNNLPGPMLHDQLGSADYRRHVFELALAELMSQLRSEGA